MPIAFPPPSRDAYFQSPAVYFAKSFTIVPAPNLGQPGVNFAQRGIGLTLDPGIPLTKARTNVRELGRQYRAPTNNNIINQVNLPVTDGRIPQRIMGALNMTLSGISRDSTGATLGNCRVLIFRTEDNSFILETTSDASGNWSVSLLKGGPFFLVEYKAGSPDVAGTSVNTLVPS